MPHGSKLRPKKSNIKIRYPKRQEMNKITDTLAAIGYIGDRFIFLDVETSFAKICKPF